MYDDLDALAADAGLELVGGAACDDASVVDHADVVGEVVRLLQILRGQQQGRTAGDQLLDDLPELLAVARVEPGRRLVHEHDRRRHDERRRQVEAAAHASGVRLGGAVRRVGQIEPVEQLARPGLRRASAHLVELADHAQVLAAGQIFVHGGELAGEPDRAPHLVGMLQDVDPRHEGAAAVRPEQRRQDPDGSRLAGSVGAEESEHGAFRHVEVDTAECGDVTEGLDEPFGVDGAWHMGFPSAFGWLPLGSRS